MGNNSRELRVGSGTIVDRRLSGKDKSIGNRERFLRRNKEQVREAVKRAIESRDIKDVGAGGAEIRIPKKDIREPVFGHAQGGLQKRVHPGNEEYVAGDRIARPPGGKKGSGGGSSDDGEAEDDFIFHLSQEEFMQVFFDDLALPNLARTTLAETPEYKNVRTGFTTDGTPTNLHLVRSMRNALGRGIAFGKLEYQRDLAVLLAELIDLESVCHLEPKGYNAAHDELEGRITALRAKIEKIPHLDPIDLRYRSRTRVPMPTSKAVMFCLMDVSGSMDEARKDLAKRFFVLLYLFLTRHYKKIDLVFIRHTTSAEEVDEHTFFHDTASGGTVVSTALSLMHKIAGERYADPVEWNVYGAQVSDGDNSGTADSTKCVELLESQILPLTRYFAYIQVAESEQELWMYYKEIQHKNFAMRKVLDRKEIYPVFRELFKKEQQS